MRSTQERIKHAITFEIIGLFLLIVGMGQFGYNMAHIGLLGFFFSLLATFWNYFFNIGFDHFMIKTYKTLQKTFWLRITHSLLFEAGLLVISLPVIAWSFNISLWEAFIMDISLVVFYVIYAYLFNLAYDKIYPVN